jgi:outer membrane protein OmpA-like peptidoglycan-associated protein
MQLGSTQTAKMIAMAPAVARTRQPVLQRKCGCGQHTSSGECEECKKKKSDEKSSRDPLLQRSAITGNSVDGVPSIVHDVLRSPGQPLDRATRSYFESRFGSDFSQVRVHADSRSAQSAQAVNSLAYTVGHDVVFGAGQFAPSTLSGKRLLAHELTHVRQQSASNRNFGGDLTIEDPRSDFENEAEQAATKITAATALAGFRNRVTPRVARSLQRACPNPPTGLGASPSAESCKAEGPGALAGSVLLFCQDSDQLTAGQTSWLASLLADAKTATKIQIHGNASTEGPAGDYNVNLACKRAAAIAAKMKAAGVTAAIEIFTHGPTSAYGGPAANRNVVVTMVQPPPAPAAPAKPPEAPAAPAAPVGPQFICGPDVTKPVQDAVSKTRTTFAGWPASDKSSACDALTSLVTGGIAWDIVDLHNNAWILAYRPACASEKASPPCGSSVQVGSDCYYAGSVNYVIFGVMCDLCDKHYTATAPAKASDFKLPGMLKLINDYKGTGFTGLSTPSANFVPSKEWATAGFNGWPSGTASPAGDRSGCLPKCASPFTGTPFSVNWVPKGAF